MSDAGCRYSRDLIILPSMCNADSLLSIPAAFDMFQDTATLHADHFDIAPAGMHRRNYFWIISKTIMHISAMPSMMDHVEARTWIQPSDRAKCERDFSIVKDGESLLTVRSIWAVVSHETGRIVPMAGLYPDDIVFDEPAPEMDFSRIGKDFTDAETVGEYTIRAVDIDLGGHMNNVNYIRAMLGCFASDDIKAMNISDIEVQYITQSYEGETLTFRRRYDDNGGTVIGAIKKDGKAAFLARLI